MRVNKRLVLSTAAVLGVSALATGGTIAYFTDKDEAVNTFTVGDVKIEMYESQLHRENSGRKGVFSALSSDKYYCDYTSAQINTANKGDMISYEKARYCTPGIDADNTTGISAIENGHTAADWTWGYTDAQIIADAATYKAVDNPSTAEDETGYFTAASNEIVPGQWVRKFTYVKNADDQNSNYKGSDAYILIRYMVPVAYAGAIEFKVPGTPYEKDVHADIDGIQGYFTAVTKNSTTHEYEAYPGNAPDAMDGYTGYIETIDNVDYRVYAAVTTDVVKAGEMTFWSPVNTIRLKTTSQNSDSEAANYVDSNALLEVRVDAQAIQAKTFSGAIEAINNLD